MEERHSFFKIFLAKAADPLQVSPAFVKAIGGVLSNEYILRGPNGLCRVVEMKRNGCQWFFKGGWGALVEDFSLQLGELLVFTLHGNSMLHLQIYGTNGYIKNMSVGWEFEKKRSTTEFSGKRANLGGKLSDPNCSRKLDFEIGKMEDRCVIEIMSSSSSDSHNTPHSESDADDEVVVPRKRAKWITHRKNYIKPNFRPKKSEVVLQGNEADQNNIKVNAGAQIHTSRKGITREQRNELVCMAQMLNLGRPLAAVILTATYARGGGIHIPNFTDELKSCISGGMGKKSGRLIRAGDGKTWPVNFVFSEARVRIIGGWARFVCHNGLTKGDVCFFELVKAGREIEMKVEIARAHKGKRI